MEAGKKTKIDFSNAENELQTADPYSCGMLSIFQVIFDSMHTN